jgi:hypothetical protein
MGIVVVTPCHWVSCLVPIPSSHLVVLIDQAVHVGLDVLDIAVVLIIGHHKVVVNCKWTKEMDVETIPRWLASALEFPRIACGAHACSAAGSLVAPCLSLA